MTPVERLSKKYEEVLVSRNELEDRLQLQEEAISAAERVMDIFKYPIDDGTKPKEVLMREENDILTFAVQIPNGEFHDKHYLFPKQLTQALNRANGYLDKDVRNFMLRLLKGYFDITENGSSTNIKMI